MSLRAAAHVRVTAYDANGKLLGEKVDNIDGDDLVRSHYSPNPRAPYTVFFPWAPSNREGHRGDTMSKGPRLLRMAESSEASSQ